MNFIVLLVAVFIPLKLLALDCKTAPPFQSIGTQEVVITIARFFWKDGRLTDEEICTQSRPVPIYDVQNRESEAYDCLKPLTTQTLSCLTKYLGDDATASVVPAIWIRKVGREIFRSYRFHAYIQNRAQPDSYLDLFSRSLTPQLGSQNIVLEGSKVSGESSPSNEGYWVRLKFK